MTVKLEVWNSLDALYNRAMDIIESYLSNGATTFGLATGGTMLPLYEKVRKSDLDFSNCQSVNLDEYVGISPQHPTSYNTFMQKELFNVKPFKVTHIPNGDAADVQKEAKHYEDILQSLTVDIQLLGVGENGHIGFNEPGIPFQKETHVAKLTMSTREANARYFNTIEEVPTEAITMGISSILRAKCILLIAAGENKRAALEALLTGEITEEIPVTSLCEHPNVLVLTDLDIR